jgi:hypothetical protein
MPVNIVSNRITLASFRAILNTWRDLINTNESDITTAQGDITTLQGQMTTAISDIALKQNANAKSTLNDGYRATAITITVQNTDVNNIIRITNAAPTNVNLPAPSTLTAAANDGSKVLIYNSATSSGNVTLVPSGCTLVGNVTVTQGQTVWLIRTTATEWTRLLFA